MTRYDGPIFDSDMHVVEDDFEFFTEYLPEQYHAQWLPSRKVGPDGEYAMYVGDRKLLNYDFRDGLVPPPGSLKEWLRAMKEGRDVDDGWIAATPDMVEPAARLAKLDEFGVEAALTYVGNFNISLACSAICTAR